MKNSKKTDHLQINLLQEEAISRMLFELLKRVLSKEVFKN